VRSRSSPVRRLAHGNEIEVMSVMDPLLPALRKNDWGSERKARHGSTGGEDGSERVLTGRGRRQWQWLRVRY
jgi:hypothetical protein